MFASPSLAGPLFRLDNFCDPDVVGEKLLETGRYNDLIDFFYGKKLHRKALELLQKFGQADEKDEVAPQLHGPQRTVAYLQNLPPELIDLILEFVEWPLKQDPDLGMEVFLADSENAETLPRLPVLGFLQRTDKDFALKYLEHIIHELNDTTPDFHQRLVNIYLEGLQTKDFKSQVERIAWKEKLLDFLRNSRHYQAYKILSQLSRDGKFLRRPSNLIFGFTANTLIQIQTFMKPGPLYSATWGSTSKHWIYMCSSSKTQRRLKSEFRSIMVHDFD